MVATHDVCGPALNISSICETFNRSGDSLRFNPDVQCPPLGVQGLQQYLRGHFLIALASMGILLNLINVPVLKTVYFDGQKSFWVLLTTLAISDIVENLIYLTTYSMVYLDSDSDYVTSFFLGNQDWILPTMSLTMTFNRWLLVLLTANRVYIIRRAASGINYADSTSKLFKLLGVIGSILLASVIFNIWRLWEFVTIPCVLNFEKEKSYKIESSPRACETPFLWIYSTIFMVGVNTVAPFGILIGCNIYIIVKLRMKQSGTNKSGAGATKRRNASRMCVAVSIAYLIFHIPYLVETVQKAFDRIISCNRYRCLDMMCSPQMQTCPFDSVRSISDAISEETMRDTLERCSPLVNDAQCFCRDLFDQTEETMSEAMAFYKYLGMILNCSFNFFIYIMFSQSFREALVLHYVSPFAGIFKRRRENATSTSTLSKEEIHMKQMKERKINAGPGLSTVSNHSSVVEEGRKNLIGKEDGNNK